MYGRVFSFPLNVLEVERGEKGKEDDHEREGIFRKYHFCPKL